MTTTFEHGGNVFAMARALGIAPEELADFSASINPLGPAPGVREALSASFDRIVHYPDREAAELRRALAGFHGIDVSLIAVSNGSTELIYLLPRIVEGRRGLIVAPAFSEYARSLEKSGWTAEYFTLSPADGFDFSLESLAARLEEGFDLLFLCNPANPTGALLPLAVVEKIHSLCRNAGTFLVIDEAFMDFCEAESAKRLICAAGGGVVLRSMTKFYAIPGLRLGYAMGPAEVIGRFSSCLEPWSVNTPAQVAGVASLADPAYHALTIRHNAEERGFLARGLSSLPGPVPYPSAANYLLVELRNGLSASQLRDELLRKRILIRDCSNFTGLDGRFFRVAVHGRDDNRRLLAALAEVLTGAG
jgi:threonine-phosphate decarboxylase